MTKHYKKLQELYITGKGLTIIVNIPINEKLPLIGDTILIDNNTYKLKNIEYSVIQTSPPKRSEQVGFIVNKLTNFNLEK